MGSGAFVGSPLELVRWRKNVAAAFGRLLQESKRLGDTVRGLGPTKICYFAPLETADGFPGCSARSASVLPHTRLVHERAQGKLPLPRLPLLHSVAKLNTL